MDAPRRPPNLSRRAFLGGSLAVAGGAVLGARGVPELTFTRSRHSSPAPDRMLDHPAGEAAVDTVVLLMLENRSFDHLFGWLGQDGEYLEAGRRLHGPSFRVSASIDEVYEDELGAPHGTQEAITQLVGDGGTYRGCTYRIPGHTWEQGRVQRDRGFLAAGSGNDEYAISYFNGLEFPHHQDIATYFTVLDHYFSSLMGPTFPNRQYFHTAQSEGRKDDPGPITTGVFKAETIWDRLVAAGVPAGYYYTDAPLLRAWGERHKPLMAPLDQYFERAAAGTLPSFSMVEPSFKGTKRADGHPRGDLRLAVAYTEQVLGALVQSPQWSRSMFILTHDEWGGFYDHVQPPRLPDARASKRDADDFSQAGFRVAAAVISPYSPGNLVDHTVYDHTSILRFLEWRFLGAPSRGPRAAPGGTWWLTTRDRHAHPIGQTLITDPVNLDVPTQIGPPSGALTPLPSCTNETDDDADEVGPFQTHPDFDAEVAREHPEATYRPWEAP